MKKILLLSTVFIGSLFIYKPAAAQYNDNGYQYQDNVNIDAQPAWGPSGYDYAENYYLPDIEAYYSVPRHQFVYFDGGNWCYSSSLPGRFANYDLYSGYKVVMNEREPWFHFNEHRALYAPYRYRHDQLVIRDNRGYARGGYSRPVFDSRGRDWGYSRRDHDDRRQESSRNNDVHRGGYDNHYRHDDYHGDRGHGRR
jgi:hypothetical protein